MGEKPTGVDVDVGEVGTLRIGIQISCKVNRAGFDLTNRRVGLYEEEDVRE